MASVPRSPLFLRECTINADWSGNAYAEAAKEMRTFRTAIPDASTTPKHLHAEEVAYYGRPPNCNRAPRVNIADIDWTTFNRGDAEDEMQWQEESGKRKVPSETHPAEGKDGETSAAAEEENMRVGAGRMHNDVSENASSGQQSTADRCAKQKEDEELDKLCEWAESTIYSEDLGKPGTSGGR